MTLAKVVPTRVAELAAVSVCYPTARTVDHFAKLLIDLGSGKLPRELLAIVTLSEREESRGREDMVSTQHMDDQLPTTVAAL